jgi:hypothetical protein
MDRSLEITVGAGGPETQFWGGLSVSVKAALQITDETTQEWHEERTEETDQTFMANTRYVTWALIDTLILNKTSTLYEYIGREEGGDPRTPGDSTSTTSATSNVFNCIISAYQDHFP